MEMEILTSKKCPVSKGMGDRIWRPEGGEGGRKAEDAQHFQCPLRVPILCSSSPWVSLMKIFMFPFTSWTGLTWLIYFALFFAEKPKTQPNKVRACFDFRAGGNANI